jgi:hypothetical protein
MAVAYLKKAILNFIRRSDYNWEVLNVDSQSLERTEYQTPPKNKSMTLLLNLLKPTGHVMHQQV